MRLLVSLVALVMLASAGAQAQSAPAVHGFLTHAAFFSLESKQANLIDPQVFVADPAAVAATGPQGIVHIAGLRPAFGVDDPNVRLMNAHGAPLGFTLAQWFGAHGQVTLAAAADARSTTMTYALAGLLPGGVYSFFENHFAPEGVTFTALDGSGERNSFTATPTGTASGSIAIPGAVTHAEGILLVYHSDKMTHGIARGKIGIDAHHQLIIRLP